LAPKITPHDANSDLIKILQDHCIAVQSGVFGAPTLEDLEFVGKVHALIEAWDA
jgi:hypothetical protein